MRESEGKRDSEQVRKTQMLFCPMLHIHSELLWQEAIKLGL